MSTEEMGTVQQIISCESGQSTKHINTSHTLQSFEVLQSLRKEKILCDINLETDNGTIICGHKVVLISASPYFYAMFANFYESNKVNVNIRELDSNILQLLVDYIYTGEIEVTGENVQALLPAANLLQLDYVKGACIEFLQKQLKPSNCLSIKAFADFYNCMELSSTSDEYIKKQFSKVIEADEFLSLSFEEVIMLISSNDIDVPFEEKVFECVINWVKHDLGHRNDSLPKLMEHVRLPLTSKEYLSKIVIEEPLLQNSPKCKDFVIEALNFHVLRTQLNKTIPKTIRNTPRQTEQKAILIFNCLDETEECFITWYDRATNLMQTIPDKTIKCSSGGIVITKENVVFSLDHNNISRSFKMLNLSSHKPYWVSMAKMLLNRRYFAVGVLDDCIYVVGGVGKLYLNYVDVFDVSIQKWRLVCKMITNRSNLGVGVLNNLLYAVGGSNILSSSLRSVECYNPSLDEWKPVADMRQSRYNHGVGVLKGVMYAIGGYNQSVALKSVEAFRPGDGVWSDVADMHLCRTKPRVVSFNGLLYVFGGTKDDDTNLNSIEIYDPDTNTWSMETLPSTVAHYIYGAVVINRAPHLRTDYLI